jgi:hypothetical protein
MASEAGAGALFSPANFFAVGIDPSSVAVADLDGDRIPDLVTAVFVGVRVLINLCDPPVQPVPTLGPVGIAILLSLLGATAYWRQRVSASRS